MDFKFLGKVFSDDHKTELRQKLIKKLAIFFDSDRSDSIPISCRITALELYENVERSWFSTEDNYIVYMENYDVMVLSQAKTFIAFLEGREPWQDYDLCIFDEGITFCVALTHNDEVKFIRL